MIKKSGLTILIITCVCTADSLTFIDASNMLGLTPPLKIIDARMENDCGTSNACGIAIRDINGTVLEYALAPRIRGKSITQEQTGKKGILAIIAEHQQIKMDTSKFYSEIKGRKNRRFTDEYYQMDTRKSFLGVTDYKDKRAKEIDINSNMEFAVYTLLRTYTENEWPNKTTAILDREYLDYCKNATYGNDCPPEKDWIIARTAINIVELLSIRLDEKVAPQKSKEGRSNCTDKQHAQYKSLLR